MHAGKAPAGSPCRTRGGRCATKYHTVRFILVPALREELDILVPEDCGPGRPWKPGPPVEAAPAAPASKPIRIGYACCSTAQQELQSQLDALEPLCKRIFDEKSSTRVKTRPKLEEALKLVYDIKEAAPDQEVILTVHGIYDPNGMGAMFFAVLAAAAQIERNYITEKTLEGQVTAAAKGNHGGRPKVIDEDSLLLARALKDRGVPVPEIAKKLTIKTGKNAGRHPSIASLYRALAEAEENEAPARPLPSGPGGPHRPRQRHHRRSGGPAR
ncbi:recombinase family protein [Streptomyces albiflaviniger]|nr:recombinase family protein [Streptomyces albiflaviniger]